jgi:hypothetical protein
MARVRVRNFPLIYAIIRVGVGVKITGIPMITRYHDNKGKAEKK